MQAQAQVHQHSLASIPARDTTPICPDGKQRECPPTLPQSLLLSIPTCSGATSVKHSFAISILAQPSLARIPSSVAAVARPPTAPAAAAAAAAVSIAAWARSTAFLRLSPASRANNRSGVRPALLEAVWLPARSRCWRRVRARRPMCQWSSCRRASCFCGQVWRRIEEVGVELGRFRVRRIT